MHAVVVCHMHRTGAWLPRGTRLAGRRSGNRPVHKGKRMVGRACAPERVGVSRWCTIWDVWDAECMGCVIVHAAVWGVL